MRRLNRFLIICIALHAVALGLMLIDFAWWPWSLAIILVTHAVIAAAGLLPRSTLLGANLVRLPAAAIRRGEIAITIDDGPDPEVTPRILNTLAAHDAKATFFCIGERAARHPELCRVIIAAGHHIENHGQRHRNYSSLFGPQGWLREINDAQTTLHSITGRYPVFFRALAGLRNPFLEPVLQRLGLRLASWTRRGYDTQTGDAARVLRRLTHNLAAGDILLLHDGNAAKSETGAPVILAVLPQLLDELSKRNLKPVTLSDALDD
jgi:peptidoglycan/xylan/chitin deacetylase (PgdA/CDA1 family)